MFWISKAVAAWLDLIPFALFFGVLAWALKRQAFAEQVRRAFPEIRTNLGLFAIDSFVVLPFVMVPSAWLVGQLGNSQELRSFWEELPVWLVCLAAVIAGDYVGYFRHRIEHTRPLWPAHATHHSDRQMNWLTLVRMHPVNRFTTVTIDVTALAVLGFPFWAILANFFVRNAWGYFIHADLPWTLGPVGSVLISPSAHRWHHVRDGEFSGKNFATVFTFWDRLHGTYQPSSKPCTHETGVAGHSGGVWFELMGPVRAMTGFVRSKLGVNGALS
jgi:sterol desaturase/sphingolipid hydroxylase (fatty acid hydroxylase superfamily)